MNAADRQVEPRDPGGGPEGERRTSAWLTVPNVLTGVRLAASGVLLWLAWAGLAWAFIWLFAILLLTDWLDGKLAILLDQRTVLGARLDSIADAALYTCLLVGTAWLRPDFFRSEVILIAAMIGSYLASVAVALFKFGRLPAYHTRAAKACWLIAAIGAITLLLGGPIWPARIALIAVILTNVEAVAISAVLTRWQVDVPSIVHAMRRTRQE